MRYLLDTHVLLWMRDNSPRLNRARWEPILFSGENEVFFSIVSLWEITIKSSIGKLAFEGEIEEFAATLDSYHSFRLLPIEPTHLGRLLKLPEHHGDPFDRLLIAQAIEIGAFAVTDDRNWKAYPVKVRW